MPPRLYCGNNANHPDVVNGTAVIGNRRGCLEKGKFIGYQQAADASFLREYVPIDDTRKYCGNHEVMPGGYDRFGGLYECFLKGMGVGKRQKAVDVLGPGGPPAPGGGGGGGYAPGGGGGGGYAPGGGGYAPGGGGYAPGGGGGHLRRLPPGMQTDPLVLGIIFFVVAVFLYVIEPAFLCEVDKNGRCIRRSLEKYLLVYLILVLIMIVILVITR